MKETTAKQHRTRRFTLGLVAVLCATPALILFGAEMLKRQPTADPVARGKYLVTYGGCNDCHTVS